MLGLRAGWLEQWQLAGDSIENWKDAERLV
jgi:hypothetical protein